MRGTGCIIVTLLVTLLVVPVLNPTFSLSLVEAQTNPKMYVDPEVTVTQMNATFSVDINIENVADLCSWQVYIYYLNQILDAEAYSEGLFMRSHGPTMFDGHFDNNYNATHGELWMYCLRTWSGTGVDGSGTLAHVTFRAKTGGSSTLVLANDVLGNSTAQRIDHTIQNGIVQVGGHDLAVTSVFPLKTVVGKGYSIRVNVTVENIGVYPDTFNITAYANATAIATLINGTLAEGSSTTFILSWNTTGFAYGNNTIGGYVWPVQYETNTANNNYSDGPVHVGVPGDVSSSTPGVYDKKCDMKDVAYLVTLFNTKPASPNWNPNADVNDDDVCNMKDIAIAIAYFNQHE
jgi:hypothetical protein